MYQDHEVYFVLYALIGIVLFLTKIILYKRVFEDYDDRVRFRPCGNTWKMLGYIFFPLTFYEARDNEIKTLGFAGVGFLVEEYLERSSDLAVSFGILLVAYAVGWFPLLVFVGFMALFFVPFLFFVRWVEHSPNLASLQKEANKVANGVPRKVTGA